MLRPTREFKTSGGHTLVLNEYITGAEHWRVRQVYRNEAPGETDKDIEAEKIAYEAVVVSLDGSGESVPQRIFDLPLPEYREVVAEITPIVEGKKKSETSLPNTSVTAS